MIDTDDKVIDRRDELVSEGENKDHEAASTSFEESHHNKDTTSTSSSPITNKNKYLIYIKQQNRLAAQCPKIRQRNEEIVQLNREKRLDVNDLVEWRKEWKASLKENEARWQEKVDYMRKSKEVCIHCTFMLNITSLKRFIQFPSNVIFIHITHYFITYH